MIQERGELFPQETINSKHVRSFKETTDIFGYSLKWYWKRVKTAVIPLIIFEVSISLALIIFNASSSITDGVNIVMLPAEVAVFAFIGWNIVRKERVFWNQALVSGAFAGFVLGAVMAVFKILAVRGPWTVFNIFTEPIFTGIAGAFVAGAVGVLVSKKQQITNYK